MQRVCLAVIVTVLAGAVLAEHTKLDNLAEAMRTIKAAAAQEMVELESQQRNDTQSTAQLLADLTSQVTEIANARDQIQQSMDDLEHEIIPELQLKKNVASEHLVSLAQHKATAEAEFSTLSRDNARNIDALSTDFDAISQLAQQVAEVLQSGDVLSLASRHFAEIAARQSYTGPALNESCTSRQLVSNVLNGLLQHLQEARDNEMSHAAQVQDSYGKYIGSLQSQMESAQNASVVYEGRVKEAQRKVLSYQAQIAQLNTKLANVNTRIARLEAFKQATLSAWAMRSDVLSQSIDKASRVLQHIVLLQAKMAVRTVTTQ